MKTIIFKIIGVSVTLLLSLSLMAQKQVHLCHGFTGDDQTWLTMQSKIESCPELSTTLNTYTSNEGITGYTSELLANFETSNSDINDICISHSFGGVVLRSMDAPNNPNFGGYITVATPHKGGQLANSVLEGKTETFLENGCKEIVQDPIEAAQLALLASPLAWVSPLITGTVGIVSNFFCDNFFDLGLAIEDAVGSPFTGPDQQTLQDLAVGGPTAAFPESTIPSIAITCDVASPVHWRLLEDKINSEVIAPVQDAEDKLYQWGDKLMGWSDFMSVSFKKPWTWSFPFLSSGLAHTAEELYGGADWLKNSEEGWVELIGASGGGHWEMQMVERVKRFDHDDYTSISGDNDPCNSEGNTEWVEMEVFVIDPAKPSDGVVPVEAQQLEGALRTIALHDISHFAQPGSNVVHEAIFEQLDEQNAINIVFKVSNCAF